jgi:hypothetical protein
MENTTLIQELWMRESTEFEMSDGTTIKGFRINYVRDLEEGETLDDIDEDKEFDDVVGGSIVPNNVDRNFDPIDDDEIVDEDIQMFSPYFYIGDRNGRPIE